MFRFQVSGRQGRCPTSAGREQQVPIRPIPPVLPILRSPGPGCLLAAVLLAAAGLVPAVTAAETAAGGDALYERVRQSAVEILCRGQLAGGGWFAEPDGLIVTAGHVARVAPEAMEVLLPAGGRVKASLVALDRGHDLALIRVPPGVEPYPVLAVAPRFPEVGREVYAFGPPVFRHRVMARGAAARPDTTFEYMGERNGYVQVHLITGLAAIGFSGGCWVDGEGRVVGSVVGEMSIAGASKGLAYASPPEAIRALLASRRSAVTPTAGCAFEELWEHAPAEIARFPAGSTGLTVAIVEKDGPAEAAKLQKGELVISADGHALNYRDEMLALIRARKPGDEMVLRILAPGQKTPLEVRLRLARAAGE